MLVLAITTAIYSYLVGPLIKFIFIGSEAEHSTLFEFIGVFVPQIKVYKENMIYVLPIFILIVGILKGISYGAQFYLMGYIGQKVIFDLRKILFERIIAQNINFFWEKSSGDITSRIISDCEKVEQSVTYALSSAIRDTIQIVVLVGLCFYLDYKLTLISFIALAIASIPLGIFGLKLKETTVDIHNKLGEIASASSDFINGIQTIHLFGVRKYIVNKFNIKLTKYFGVIKKSLFIRSIQSPVMELIGVLGICLTILYAKERIISGELKPEHFISLFASILMLYNPVKNIARMNNFFTSGMAGAKRIFEIIDEVPEIYEDDSGIDIRDLKDKIEMRSISLSYGEREILRNVNLVINKGMKVGIAGESGSGKSTLVLLLSRLIKPTKGEIIIDGINIENIKLDSLRNLFSVVSQDVFLFNDTIYNNILIGKPDAKENEIIEATKRANLHDFIQSLPNGFHTEIGERGIKLSGGERQRLSIARAFLKDSPIIILDEATSSLDIKNEVFIRDILDNLMSHKTTIIISHRLSFLKNCDVIYFIKDNSVIEKGTFEELINKKSLFYDFYRIQINNEV
ncbi:MAG: ABC transporter ATP-binding protein/permease [Deltaproteobacteria bacterium]|nr:ABC transporter ATP-binding protein/permease [Deltaproteobacteria bacterium]